VVDDFPAGLSGVSWTCTGTGGASCTASGTGDIHDTANLPPGSSLTYTAGATVSAAATGLLLNSASVSVPSGVAELDPTDNSAADSTEVNLPPAAGDDSAEVGEDAALSQPAPGVLEDDSDPNGDPISVTGYSLSSALGAGVTVAADGSYQYDPRASTQLQALSQGVEATDTFTYTVSDDWGSASTARVFITVIGANDAPQLEDLPPALAVDENGTAVLSGEFSDADADDTFSLSVDWGDGSPVETFPYEAGASAFSLAHRYLDDRAAGAPSDE
jgi:VCBS repeat-containing protein